MTGINIPLAIRPNLNLKIVKRVNAWWKLPYLYRLWCYFRKCAPNQKPKYCLRELEGWPLTKVSDLDPLTRGIVRAILWRYDLDLKWDWYIAYEKDHGITIMTIDDPIPFQPKLNKEKYNGSR
jgi:hypothetical protein